MYDYGRYLPLLDPTVDLMVSRDLDSRLTTREQTAVEDWLNTGLAFHVMRDNPQHGTEILGGMWGARMHVYPQLLLTEKKCPKLLLIFLVFH